MELIKRSSVAAIVFCLLAFSANLFGADECSVWVKVYKSAKLLDVEDEKTEPFEIGRFDFASVTEGVSATKKFKIKGTRLNVFVGIFYDDDGEYYGNLADAMTITLAISTASKQTLSSNLATTTSQIYRGKDFGFSNVGTIAKFSNRWYDAWVKCRLKKDSTKAVN